MDTSKTRDVLLSHLKMSNLNSNLVESPFSVTISIKKSFFMDKFGQPRASRLSSLNFDHMTDELYSLRCENKTLQEALGKVEHAYLEA